MNSKKLSGSINFTKSLQLLYDYSNSLFIVTHYRKLQNQSVYINQAKDHLTVTLFLH